MNAQTVSERKIIAEQSNKSGNILLQQKLSQENLERKARLANFLKTNPNYNPITKIGEYGTQELLDVLPNGEKVFARTDNEGAALTARANTLYNGGSLGINIQGQNMIAGVWDGGNVRDTHIEFMVNGASKITNLDGSPYQDHATHVAGTICAQGIILSSVRGVAFNSSVRSYNWDNDLSEMTSEAGSGLLVSNHSYASGQLSSAWYYGAYDSRAQQVDNITYNNPFYLPVYAAGNDRNVTTQPALSQLNAKNGYDLIFGHANAKNALTVAAVYKVDPYTGSSSVTMSPFSSWGPSDDGRIKPEISMKGVDVRSTLAIADNATGLMSGTSMAAPGITAVTLLLQQYHNQLYSNYLKSASVKGLILHTADEAGSNPGPDYKFGWGLVNAQKAAITIRDKNSTGANQSIIQELNLTSGSTYSKTITASGTNPLKVSISWTDPQASQFLVNNGATDPNDKYLVNDLDVKVIKDGNTYYPWKLQGMSNPSAAATNSGTNDVDNFERVDINNPSGTYTIVVTNKGNLRSGSQNFTLIVTSDNLSNLSTNDLVKNNDLKVDVFPNPASDFIQINDKDDNIVVNIYDVSGKLVLTSKLTEKRLNISSLLKGDYVGNYINKNGQIKSFKFIKK